MRTPSSQKGRLEKDVIQKSNMHVDGKSDGREVRAEQRVVQEG
jgi:hypothetical protein